MLRELITSCDAFPKVDVSYLNPTTSGGLTSLAAYTLIGLLSVSEVWRYFMVPQVDYSLQVDEEMQSEIKLHFDISVATPCEQLIVGVVDAGGQKDILNDQVGAETIIWHYQDSRPDCEGCRIYATLPLNKVAGELLILPNARVLPGPFGHVLILIDQRVNFSHKIHRFSFGPEGDSVGFKEKYFRNSLNGAYQPSVEKDRRFTYNLSVTPTKIMNGEHIKLSTNQYSVTGLKSQKDDPNVILPGLYFSYELEPLAVTIRRQYQSFLWFLVNVLGIIGGIYTCSGLLHHSVHHLYVYYISKRNAFRERYLGALDGRLPSGSISYTRIATADDDKPCGSHN